jgi:LysM repeat protein
MTKPAAAVMEMAALPPPAPEKALAPVPAERVSARHEPGPAVVAKSMAATEQSPALGKQVAMLPPMPQIPAPVAKVAAEPASRPSTYTVLPGDCLWDIAARCGVSAARLAQMNGLTDPRLIHPGQQLRVPGVNIYFDGKLVTGDAPATVVEGRTIAPLRVVVEQLGGAVAWDPNTRSATADARGRKIAVSIGSAEARVDGAAVSMGAPAELTSSRTMVPLRFLGDALKLSLRCEESAVYVASLP